MKGIDVSEHNGLIDWEKVKNDGIDFVLIRTGYGVESAKQIDKRFERNYSECKRLGIPVGAYHYSYAQNAAGAKREAQFVLKLIKNKQFEFPIFFDIEDKTQVPLGKTICTEMVNAFCSELEKENYWAGVYSFDSFFESNLSADIPKKYSAWVARVPNQGNAIVFPKSMDSGLIAIHQYSWKGKIDGIAYDTDLNNCFNDFPKLIKNAKKNNFSKATNTKFYNVVAERKNVPENEIAEMQAMLKHIQMDAKITEV